MNILPLNRGPARPLARPGRRLALEALVLALLTVPSSGCYLYNMPWMKPEVPKPPESSFELRPDGLVPKPPPEPGTAEADLAGAHELFRNGQYYKAEILFHRLADDSKNLPALAAEARYFEAECLRVQGYYPKAGDTYVRLLKDFQTQGNAYKDQACQRFFDIANYWLDDTREEMRETREKNEGKRWFVWPRFISFEKPKPLVDRESRAVQLLEQIRFNDMGPLSDKALFLAGSVKFYNRDFKESDYFFSQISERHPNSELAPKAVELAIISKHLSTGGSDYDGRKVAEARKLVHKALSEYPELASKKEEFEKQLKYISAQQADKDFKMAEYWRKTKHPGAAYFYYDMVERRYPGLEPYCTLARQHKQELKDKVVEEQKKAQESVNPMQQDKSNWWWPFSSPRKDAVGPAPPNPPQNANLPGGAEVAPAPRPTQ